MYQIQAKEEWPLKYYRGVDYFLFFEDFPHMGVPGVIAANSDGTANIYINTLYSPDCQRRAIRHELRHLARNHFYCDWMTLEEKELRAPQGGRRGMQRVRELQVVQRTAVVQHL